MIAARLQTLYKIAKTTVMSWWDNDPFTQSAAVAYYTIFSFPALMILYFACASIFVEEQTLQIQTYDFLAATFGESSAEQFSSIVDNTAPEDTSLLAFIIGGTTLLFAGLRLFLQFQKALNHIWGVREDAKGGITTIIIRRAASFGVMLGIGFTLIVSLLMTSLISFFTDWVVDNIHPYFAYMAHIVNFTLSFVTLSLMFGLLLKMLPDRPVGWHVAWPGAMLSALLFIFGEYMLGIYFSTARPDSAYGVTGSLILLMIWVSYSCVILLLGAEFSKCLHDRRTRTMP